MKARSIRIEKAVNGFTMSLSMPDQKEGGVTVYKPDLEYVYDEDDVESLLADILKEIQK